VEATETGLLRDVVADGGGIADDAEVGLLFDVLSDCAVVMCGRAEVGLFVMVGLEVGTATTRRRAGSARSPDGILWGSAGRAEVGGWSASTAASRSFAILLCTVSTGVSFGMAVDSLATVALSCASFFFFARMKARVCSDMVFLLATGAEGVAARWWGLCLSAMRAV
jgi:hypothetical protein